MVNQENSSEKTQPSEPGSSTQAVRQLRHAGIRKIRKQLRKVTKLQLAFDAILAFATVVYTLTALYGLWITQRAYVNVQPGRFGSLMMQAVEGKPLIMIITIRNNGRNPAYKTHEWEHMQLVSTSAPPSMDNLPAFPFGPKNTIASDITYPFPIKGTVLNKTDADDMAANRVQMYVWGEIDYETFHLVRYTRFCFHSIGIDVVAPCDAYNDSDQAYHLCCTDVAFSLEKAVIRPAT